MAPEAPLFSFPASAGLLNSVGAGSIRHLLRQHSLGSLFHAASFQYCIF